MELLYLNKSKIIKVTKSYMFTIYYINNSYCFLSMNLDVALTDSYSKGLGTSNWGLGEKSCCV